MSDIADGNKMTILAHSLSLVRFFHYILAFYIIYFINFLLRLFLSSSF